MIGKKSTSSSTGPTKQAAKYLKQGSSALTSAYAQTQPLIQQATSTISGNLPTVLGQTLNNPGLAAGSGYDQDVLGGKYLGAGNPYLAGQIADTNEDVTNTVNGALGSRGLAGGSAAAQILGRELARNETNLRYTDYANERANMNTAASNATSVAGAGNQGIQTLLQYLTGGAELPIDAASKYASGLGGLWGGSTTTTQKQGLGSTLGTLAGSALSGWASGGFKGI